MGAQTEAWEHGPGWPRYLELLVRRPELFVNGPDSRFEIVLEPVLVARAERNEASRIAHLGRATDEARVGVAFEDSYLAVIRDAVRFPDGVLGTYMRVVPAATSPGVAILPLDGDRIVLVRHYRHATRRDHLEIPRGFATPHSSPESDARRELLEEIGSTASDLIPLGSMHPNTGISSEEVNLFLAAVEDLGAVDVQEGIGGIMSLSVVELTEAIGSGRITDSFTIVAFFRALLQGLIPRLSVRY